MTLGKYDLTISPPGGGRIGFFFAEDQDQAMQSLLSYPQVSNGSNYSSPVTAGGVYDVRDADADKSIAHIDWSKGEGQDSLDTADSVSNRYAKGKCIDISQQGSFRLMKAISYSQLQNTSGPAYSALGYFWLSKANGTLVYSADGESWTSAAITASPAINSAISGFTTDGVSVYFCMAYGNNKGVWKSTPGTSPIAFSKLGTSPTTEAIHKIAYCGGILYAATSTGAGAIDTTTGAYSQETPEFLNAVQSIELVPLGNKVYWVFTQGNKTTVYELDFDPDTTVYRFKQFAEFPLGFIATCATGYLSNIYIGGYFESIIPDRGKGAVYVASSERMYFSPLFELGKQPEYTEYPDSNENDNRVVGMCPYGKDLYVLTNTAAYRWDIDNGGYSHVFDFLGSKLGIQAVSWNEGSNISWDCTDLSNESPPHDPWPTGWARTDLTQVSCTAKNTFSLGKYTFETVETNTNFNAYCGQMFTITPSDWGEGLDNSKGTTIEIKFGAESHGLCFQMEVGDGTKKCRMYATFLRQSTYDSSTGAVTWTQSSVFELLSYNPTYNIWYIDDMVLLQWQRTKITSTYGEDHVVRLTMAGSTVTLSCDDKSISSTSRAFDMSGDDYIKIWMTATPYYDGAPQYPSKMIIYSTLASYTQVNGLPTNYRWARYLQSGDTTKKRKLQIDYLKLNSVEAVPSGQELEIISHPGITFNAGKLLVPYSVGSEEISMAISTTSSGSGTVTVTTESSEPDLTSTNMPSGTVVNISGTSQSTLNGYWVATRVDAHTFTIPATVESSGTGGTVRWNNAVGYGVTSDSYADNGYIQQSSSTFHSGSVKKDFRYIDVSHEAMPPGTSMACKWNIDGGESIGLPTYISANKTRFYVNASGYSITPTIYIYPNTQKDATPIITGVNVIWNFIMSRRHRYAIDLRTGASGGRWDGDPYTAWTSIKELASRRCLFEDAINGSYWGIVESIEYTKANKSDFEGPSGIAIVTVKEEI